MGKLLCLIQIKKVKKIFEAKEYVSSFITKGGMENITDVIKDYVKSFEKSNLTNKQIEEKYGIEAQNNSLNYVRQKKNTARAEFLKSIEVKDDKEKSNNEVQKKHEENNKNISQEENER